MRKRLLEVASLLIAVFIVLAGHMAAQGQPLPPEVALHGYAEMILVNGKIVSMDDRDYNQGAGTIYEAMAVKRDQIIALGTTQRMRSLAGPDTREIDLNGQLVIPGIIETHAHIYGNARLSAEMGMRSPDRGINARVQAGRDIESTRLRIENAVREALTKVQPGDWVLLGVTPNNEEEATIDRIDAWFSGQGLESRDRLDDIAPDNPVLTRAGRRGILNSQGWEIANSISPVFTEFITEARGARVVNDTENGLVGSNEMLQLYQEVFYNKYPVSLYAEVIRRDLEMAASHGITTFSSRVPTPKIMDGFLMLNREKKMPIRFGALYEVHRKPADPNMTRQFYRMTGNLTNLGNDFLWIHGVASELWDASYPEGCLGPDLEAPPVIKAREMCPAPGDMYYDTLKNALESGWRLAGIHGVGSHAARLFIQMIESVIESKGLTVQDIRNLRMTMEHAEVMGALPDVMEGLKKYGIYISGGPPRMLREPEYVKDYGPAVRPFMQPVKTWLDYGIRVVGQNHTYRGVGYYWTKYMTREIFGKPLLADQKLDRVTVLKMWTTWASEYVMKEDLLGTLEVGKLADFVVLDKDYLTIPIDQIPTIMPKMTVIGGKTIYLNKDYAEKLGTAPIGYQHPDGIAPWGCDLERRGKTCG